MSKQRRAMSGSAGRPTQQARLGQRPGHSTPARRGRVPSRMHELRTWRHHARCSTPRPGGRDDALRAIRACCVFVAIAWVGSQDPGRGRRPHSSGHRGGCAGRGRGTCLVRTACPARHTHRHVLGHACLRSPATARRPSMAAFHWHGSAVTATVSQATGTRTAVLTAPSSNAASAPATAPPTSPPGSRWRPPGRCRPALRRSGTAPGLPPADCPGRFRW